MKPPRDGRRGPRKRRDVKRVSPPPEVVAGPGEVVVSTADETEILNADRALRFAALALRHRQGFSPADVAERLAVANKALAQLGDGARGSLDYLDLVDRRRDIERALRLWEAKTLPPNVTSIFLVEHVADSPWTKRVLSRLWGNGEEISIGRAKERSQA